MRYSQNTKEFGGCSICGIYEMIRKDMSICDFQELAEKRYSCRNFSQRKVEKELVDQIIKAGITAPTAVNTQPVKIFWLNSEKQEKISGRYATIPFGADTFLVVGYKEAEGWVRSFDQRNFADIDAGIIATHMMLEIEDLGLSTTWVGYFDAPRLQSLYPEMKEYHLIALFPIGYAAEDAAPSDRHFKRKKTEEIVKIL